MPQSFDAIGLGTGQPHPSMATRLARVGETSDRSRASRRLSSAWALAWALAWRSRSWRSWPCSVSGVAATLAYGGSRSWFTTQTGRKVAHLMGWTFRDTGRTETNFLHAFERDLKEVVDGYAVLIARPCERARDVRLAPRYPQYRPVCCSDRRWIS